ncbi:MAG: hypothetical protein AUF79_14150 [Crenarchaeota archaeon 13_1_20CM_2_51_8]|nr:MAG: hypothetical protein AUF79_14150 [Crenarchaeota archaeon 13_1_20CM_2_51_8]
MVDWLAKIHHTHRAQLCYNSGGFCTLFYTYNPNVQVRTFYFLVDTAFYGTLAVGIVTTSREPRSGYRGD